MSIQVIAKVLPKRWGSPSRKIVALKLADVAREDGTRIYPAIATVAAEAELSERQVQRVMEEFRKEGLLVVVRKGGGRNRPTEYRFDMEVIERLPSAKPICEDTEEADEKGDTMSPFTAERVTSTTEKGDTMSPNPSLPLSTLSSKERSASNEAGADAPSVSSKVWKEGLDLLKDLPSKPNRSIIGKWLKRVSSTEGKEKLLAMIRTAARAGTAEPIAYVTKALDRDYPPPPDPKGLDAVDWQRNAQAAIKTKLWSEAWGPRPGRPGCLLPPCLIDAVAKALSERRVTA